MLTVRCLIAFPLETVRSAKPSQKRGECETGQTEPKPHNERKIVIDGFFCSPSDQQCKGCGEKQKCRNEI